MAGVITGRYRHCGCHHSGRGVGAKTVPSDANIALSRKCPFIYEVSLNPQTRRSSARGIHYDVVLESLGVCQSFAAAVAGLHPDYRRSLSPSLSLSLPPLSPSVPLSLSPSRPLSFSLTHYLSLPPSLPLSLSLCLFFGFGIGAFKGLEFGGGLGSKNGV